MRSFSQTLLKIQPQNAASRASARARLEQLTMPHWALGKLMDLAEDLAGMTGSTRPSVTRKAIVTMAADHGVAEDGVSRYPSEVTAQMVHNFVRGGAGINAIARNVSARVIVVDMGVAQDLSALAEEGKILSRRVAAGTQNISRGPAMSREDAARCVEIGIAIAEDLSDSVDLFGTGEMGIGNTTPSSAIVAAMTETPVEKVTGYGTGIDPERFRHKVSIIKKALEANRPRISDPLDVLAKVGGFEIGGIAGLILGAAARKKPILLDGFISTAGALIAYGLEPKCAEYMIAAHHSVEQGHRIALERLSKEPLLDLNLRLGEGTGAALAMHLVDAAVRILTEVATFEEASVSKAEA